jgi:hypothetical protein
MPDQVWPVAMEMPHNSREFLKAMDELWSLVDGDERAIFESEANRAAHYHSELQRQHRSWHRSKQCVVPGCLAKSITSSHSIQRAGPLLSIAEDGHVLAPRFDHKSGTLGMARVGVRDASTFPGFCKGHEQLFAGFESRGVIETEEDVALQVFRTICREVVRKRADVESAERVLHNYDNMTLSKFKTLLRARIGPDRADNLESEIRSVKLSGGRGKAALQEYIGDAKRTLSEWEQEYLEPAYTDFQQKTESLSHLVIRVRQPLPVCLAGSGNFIVDDAGQHIDVRVFLNVWPSAGDTVIMISSTSARESCIQGYLRTNAIRNECAMLSMIETWMVRGSDHWFIRPSTWNRIPGNDQRAILADMHDLRFNIGQPYGVSIFNELRQSLLRDSTSLNALVTLGNAELGLEGPIDG